MTGPVATKNLARNDLLARLGIEFPILLSPMAGGPGSPELAAAVSNAGGLGSIGVAYLTPDQIAAEIRRVREKTSRPFNVNLFAGGFPDAAPSFDPAPMLEILSEIHRAWGLPAPAVPQYKGNPFRDQFEAVLEARPAAFSFTFGIPDRALLARCRERGIVTLGTATTIGEGRMLAEAGVDAIVIQGSEAGAHRGTFAGSFESSMVPTRDLLRGLSGTNGTIPVVASGGLMTGEDVAALLDAGAAAVQLGTAFLASPESGAPEAHKQAILAARSDTTVITRVFSGRPARGLKNAFIEKLDGREHTVLPFPIQNSFTRMMRSTAAQRGDAGYLSLWAGQGVARARSLPAAELVARLIDPRDTVSQPLQGLPARGL